MKFYKSFVLFCLVFILACAKDHFPDGVSENCNCETLDLDYLFVGISLDGLLHEEWSTNEVSGGMTNNNSFEATTSFFNDPNSEIYINFFNDDSGEFAIGQEFDFSKPNVIARFCQTIDEEKVCFTANPTGKLTITKLSHTERYLGANFNFNLESPDGSHVIDALNGRLWLQE